MITERLRRVLKTAQRRGYAIRFESLEGLGTNWCEIAGRITLFVDSSQTAAEQHAAVKEILAADSTIARPAA